jgi:hypothetical protein
MWDVWRKGRAEESFLETQTRCADAKKPRPSPERGFPFRACALATLSLFL